MTKQSVQFLERWQRGSRANRAALQTGDCVCNSQSLFNRQPREQPVDESAVKCIACARRVLAIDGEGGRVDILVAKVRKNTFFA